MPKPIIRIYDNDTFIDREMTAEEFSQYQKDKAEAEARKAEAEAKEIVKSAAQAKLAALGLTPEDLKALGFTS
jgi:hypothetical protein